jgi:acetyl esterase/lipase
LASRHSYGDHPSQFGELHEGGDDVAVLIHGGFWRARYGLDLERDIAADLVARGWTVWNIEYRRMGDGGV